jgi:hypothetical protein
MSQTALFNNLTKGEIIVPETRDDQTVRFMAVVEEILSQLPTSVIQGLSRNPEIIRKALRLWCPWYGREVLNFTCSPDVAVEAKKLEEIRNDVDLRVWGERAFESAFATVQVHVEEVQTVRVKLFELGLTRSDNQFVMRKRAASFGLHSCPLFVVYQYRLHYEDQPLNEVLHILTDSVDIGNGESSLFAMTHKDLRDSDEEHYSSYLILDGHYGDDAFPCDPNSEWVFALKGE